MQIGRYRVVGEIGIGGAGRVVRAEGPSGPVAIKLLRRADGEALARFERERRLLGQVSEGDGFVPLLDAGEAPDGKPFIVVPFYGGGTLRDRLERGPLAIAEARAIVTALARALGIAHARGVVHRDVKPENVLFTDDGRPLVADLGLAKHVDRASPGASASVALTGAGELRGTIAYMAPEQARDARAVGPPADVFALGAVLHECLSGAQAFAGPNPMAVLARIDAGTFEPIGRDVPRWLARVVERALAPDPRARFANGEEMARALERGPGRRSGRAVAGGLAVAATAVAAIFAARPGAPAPAPPAAAPPTAQLPPAAPAPSEDLDDPASIVAVRDPAAQRRRALELEEHDDVPRAVRAWERVIDASVAGAELRAEARAHLRSLVPRLTPEKAPRATFRVKALVFVNGNGSARLSRADVDGLRASFDACAREMLEASRGILRLEVALETVHRSLPDGIDVDYFWQLLDREAIAEIAGSEHDAVLAYVVRSWPVAPDPTRMTMRIGPAIYSANFIEPGHGARTGEHELVEVHRLLREALVGTQGWPARLIPTGAPETLEACCGGAPAPALVRHAWREHLTGALWRTASSRRTARNPWNRGDARRVRVAGPYRFEGGPGAGLDLVTPDGPFAPLEALGRLVALNERFGAHENQVALVEVRLRAERPTRVLLAIGSDDGVRVELNGERLYEVRRTRGNRVDDDRAHASLRAGANRLILKVENSEGGGWSCAVRILAADEGPCPDEVTFE